MAGWDFILVKFVCRKKPILGKLPLCRRKLILSKTSFIVEKKKKERKGGTGKALPFWRRQLPGKHTPSQENRAQGSGSDKTNLVNNT
jgi:hypothetical protein